MFLSYPKWHYFLFINASVLNSFLLLNPSYLSISLVIIIRFFSFVHDISHCLWYWVEACVSFSHSISFYNFLWSYLFLRELSQGLQSLHLHQTSSTIHLDGWDKSGCLLHPSLQGGKYTLDRNGGFFKLKPRQQNMKMFMSWKRELFCWLLLVR